METYSITGKRKEELMEIARVLGVTITAIPQPTPDLSDIVIATYDEPFQELLAKSNETFKGTPAEITISSGEVKQGHETFRSALRTTALTLGFSHLPITPLQSEELVLQYQQDPNSVPKPLSQYWEDLALILYSLQGTNQQKANYLFQQLQANNLPTELPLLIINPGLEKDTNFPHNAKFTVIPGLTQSVHHETLKQRQDHKFNYGLEHGLPSINDLGTGNRTLYMPSSNKDLGLKVLYRGGFLALISRNEGLIVSDVGGRVTLART